MYAKILNQAKTYPPREKVKVNTFKILPATSRDSQISQRLPWALR